MYEEIDESEGSPIRHLLAACVLSTLFGLTIWLGWRLSDGWLEFAGLLLTLWWLPAGLAFCAVEQGFTFWESHDVDLPRWDVDAEGITFVRDREHREKLRFGDLQAVHIRTTSAGPFVEDFYYTLSDQHSTLSVPLSVACEHGLADHLYGLPGFDHAAVIEASCTVDDRVFEVWRADWLN
jgi:hypothetical protein